MRLIDRVLEAHGGLERWRKLSFFTAHVSISGAALPPADGCPPSETSHVMVHSYSLPTARTSKPTLREFVVEGETGRPHVTTYGAVEPDRCGVCTPDRVEFRGGDGNVLQSLDDPMASLLARPADVPFRPLERAYIFAFLVWDAVVGPFMLDDPDVHVMERVERNESGSQSLTLEVRCPRRISPLAPDKVLHVGPKMLLRRSDCQLDSLRLGRVADTASSPADFGGVIVSTLRRLQAINRDGIIEAQPLIDLEIFDVRFR
jgi:hypothetical protein